MKRESLDACRDRTGDTNYRQHVGHTAEQRPKIALLVQYRADYVRWITASDHARRGMCGGRRKTDAKAARAAGRERVATSRE